MSTAVEVAQQVAAALPHSALTVGLPAGARPWSALQEGPALGELVEAVRTTLGGCEERVAASTLQLGLVARLWSVTLGSVALSGRLLDLDSLSWTHTRGSVALHLYRPRLRPAEDLLPLVWSVAGPLEDRARAEYGLARGLLRGNAASGLVGTARLLGRPSLAADLLTDELFAGTFDGDRRRSCCLFYRVPGGGVCGDCCFTRPPAARS